MSGTLAKSSDRLGGTSLLLEMFHRNPLLGDGM